MEVVNVVGNSIFKDEVKLDLTELLLMVLQTIVEVTVIIGMVEELTHEGIISFHSDVVTKVRVLDVKVIATRENENDGVRTTITSGVVTDIGTYMIEAPLQMVDSFPSTLRGAFCIIGGTEVYESLRSVIQRLGLVSVVHLVDNGAASLDYPMVFLLFFVRSITKMVFRTRIKNMVLLVKSRIVEPRVVIEGIEGITVSLSVVAFIDRVSGYSAKVVYFNSGLNFADAIKIVVIISGEENSPLVVINVKKSKSRESSLKISLYDVK